MFCICSSFWHSFRFPEDLVAEYKEFLYALSLHIVILHCICFIYAASVLWVCMYNIHIHMYMHFIRLFWTVFWTLQIFLKIWVIYDDLLFIFCHVARGILAPHPGMETSPLALEVWSLNHWTTREVLAPLLLIACMFLKVKTFFYTISIDIVLLTNL